MNKETQTFKLKGISGLPQATLRSLISALISCKTSVGDPALCSKTRRFRSFQMFHVVQIISAALVFLVFFGSLHTCMMYQSAYALQFSKRKKNRLLKLVVIHAASSMKISLYSVWPLFCLIRETEPDECSDCLIS